MCVWCLCVELRIKFGGVGSLLPLLWASEIEHGLWGLHLYLLSHLSILIDLIFLNFILIACVSLCVCVCGGFGLDVHIHVEVRRQLHGGFSLPHLCGFWGLNLGCQACVFPGWVISLALTLSWNPGPLFSAACTDIRFLISSYVCMYLPMNVGRPGGQKRMLHWLELDLQMVVSCLPWVLGTELVYSVRAKGSSVLNHLSSPALLSLNTVTLGTRLHYDFWRRQIPLKPQNSPGTLLCFKHTVSET